MARALLGLLKDIDRYYLEPIAHRLAGALRDYSRRLDCFAHGHLIEHPHFRTPGPVTCLRCGETL